MIQPADPIAFSRFGEENNLRSGDPDYDPEAALKAYGQADTPAPETGEQIAESAGEPAADSPATDSLATDSPAPPVAAVIPHRPGKMPDGEETADIRESTDTGENAAVDEPVVSPSIHDPVPADLPVNDPVQPERFQETADEKAEIVDYSDPVPAGAVVVTAVPQEQPSEEAETVLAEAAPEENVPELAYPEESIWYTPEEGSIFTLIPAEERPPMAIDTVPEIAVIPPVYPVEEPPSVYNAIPGVFSVPSVGELEPGKYYLQLGAYSKTDAVEQEITKIEKNLPLAVQCTGGADKPVYRILVGPVNHGESGALLQRFKSIGYKDAFVRRGE
jgi:hypothetical protein